MTRFTNHLGKLASAFARMLPATLLVLAACESTEPNTGLQESEQLPPEAAFAHFLARNGPVRDLSEIAVLTTEHPDNFAHVVWTDSFRKEGADLHLVGIKLSESGMLAMHMLASRPSQSSSDEEVAAYYSPECRLANYRDRPGAWDFIRNSPKAQRWLRFGNCVFGLIGSVRQANKSGAECFVSTTPVWNEDEDWYDLRSWIVCVDGGLL